MEQPNEAGKKNFIDQIKKNIQRIPYFFQQISYFLKAVWIFFPGFVFLGLGYFAFCSLSQGKDLIYQSTDNGQSGIYLVLAAMFWVFTTWYTARLVAYNRNDLYKVARWPLYHMPRLLAFLVFWVLWLAVYFINDINENRTIFLLASLGIEFLLYILMHKWLDLKPESELSPLKIHHLRTGRWIARSLIVFSSGLIIWRWMQGDIKVMLFTLPVIQFGLLYLLVVRRPLSHLSGTPGKYSLRNIHNYAGWLNRYLRWTLVDTIDSRDTKTEESIGFAQVDKSISWKYERPVFIIYHLFALAASGVYLIAIFSLSFARHITSFPLAMLGFGVLLGIGNFITLLSRRRQINFHFLLILVVVVFGWIHDPHKVALGDGNNDYASRPTLKAYTQMWLDWHKEDLEYATPSNPYPVFFVLADGGASRSGYWAAGVLDLIHDSTRVKSSGSSLFQQHLFCLSGASGGSVGNGTFLAQLAAEEKNPALQKDSLSRTFLRNDFLSYTLARLLSFDLLSGLSPLSDRAQTLEKGMEYPVEGGIMQQMMQGDIGQLIPGKNYRIPAIIINTTRVQDGSPAVVSTIRPDTISHFFENRTDVLGLVQRDKFMRLSTSVILGARFPYMSPGGFIEKENSYHYFVDGGYFDNSGAGAVHEMIQALERMSKDTTDQPFADQLKNLRFYVIHVANSPYSLSEYKKIHPLVNNLATPLLTLAGSYGSQTSVNDGRLRNYLQEMSDQKGNYTAFNLYLKGTVESFPMNWVISKLRLNQMDDRINMDNSGQLQLAWNIRNYHKRMDSLKIFPHRMISKYDVIPVQIMSNIREQNAPDDPLKLDTTSLIIIADSVRNRKIGPEIKEEIIRKKGD